MRSNQSTYGSANEGRYSSNKYKMELLKIRESLSFKIGVLFTSTIKRPWRIIVFPFHLLFILIRGRKASMIQEPSEIVEAPEYRRSMVFFSSNDVSSYEFKNMISIMEKIRLMDSSQELILFASSSSLFSTQGHEFSTYQIPNKREFSDMDTSTWNSMIEQSLTIALRVHKPSLFVFNGNFPFRGMLNAINSREEMMKVWLKEKLFQSKKSIPIDKINSFDAIVRPNDIIEINESNEPKYSSDLVKCDPIFSIDEDELYSREISRNHYGLKNGVIFGFVDLREGEYTDEHSHISICLKIIDEIEGVHLMVNRRNPTQEIPWCKDRIQFVEQNHEKYFNAFDFAIITGEFNAIQKIIRHSMPALCLPRGKGGSEDQFTRGKIVSDSKGVITLSNPHERQIGASLDRLLDQSVQSAMKEKLRLLQKPNGSYQVARWILDNIPNGRK